MPFRRKRCAPCVPALPHARAPGKATRAGGLTAPCPHVYNRAQQITMERKVPVHRLLPFAAATLLALSMASLAADEETAVPDTTAARVRVDTGNEARPSDSKENPEPEVVCRMEAEVGSRVKKKICRKKSDTEDTERETRDAMRDVDALGNKTYSAAPGR